MVIDSIPPAHVAIREHANIDQAHPIGIAKCTNSATVRIGRREERDSGDNPTGVDCQPDAVSTERTEIYYYVGWPRSDHGCLRAVGQALYSMFFVRNRAGVWATAVEATGHAGCSNWCSHHLT